MCREHAEGIVHIIISHVCLVVLVVGLKSCAMTKVRDFSTLHRSGAFLGTLGAVCLGTIFCEFSLSEPGALCTFRSMFHVVRSELVPRSRDIDSNPHVDRKD